MKVNVLIYGAGSFAEKIINSELNLENLNILAFVETKKTKNEFMGKKVVSLDDMDKYDYDLIIIASSYESEIKNLLIEHSLDIRKCFFIRELYNVHNYKDFDVQVINKFIHIFKSEGSLRRNIEFISKSNGLAYSMVDVQDKFTFIGYKNDYIPWKMNYENEVYSSKEIESFFDLSDKFFDVGENGYFFDCGCNILTTSIYAHSVKDNLRIVGFEPVKKTYKLALANAVLNDIYEDTTLVNKGLSNEEGIAVMQHFEGDCGQNSIIANQEEAVDVEEVNITTLDTWVEQNNIDINKISYFWIDAEGYEGFIIDGAMNILRKRRIPIFLEFRYDDLKRNGCLDLLIKNLAEVYSKFIVVETGGKFDLSNACDMQCLYDMKQMNTNIFLIP